ncbi:MAG: anion permease, partial [Phaeodactylibacter sp.]|nr:anion permease [Phaeodactylibacter sp.]
MALQKKHVSRILVFLLLVLLFLGHWSGLYSSLLGLTKPESISLAILLATAVLWVSEIIPLYITSLAILLLQIIWLLPAIQTQGQTATKNDFLIAFFSDITLLFIGGFVLAKLMNKFNLSDLFARKILKRTGTRPSAILLSIILVSALLSMWMSNTATAAMMFAIIAPIAQGLPEGSTFSKALALSIPFACNIGGIGTPIGTPPNAIAMDYLQALSVDITFTKWMAIAIPLMLVLLVLLWRLLLWLYPPKATELHLDLKSSKQLSRKQIAVIGIFILTVFGWLSSGQTGISLGMVGLMVVIVAFGSKLLDTRDFRNLSWDILFMLGG